MAYESTQFTGKLKRTRLVLSFSIDRNQSEKHLNETHFKKKKFTNELV